MAVGVVVLIFRRSLRLLFNIVDICYFLCTVFKYVQLV